MTGKSRKRLSRGETLAQLRQKLFSQAWRQNAKLDLEQIKLLALLFALGEPLAVISVETGISTRTIRQIFSVFREYLNRPALNRWVHVNRTKDAAITPAMQAQMKVEFCRVLGRCYANYTCYRNYTLGNRKSRLCRSCPIGAASHTSERHADYLYLVDRVRRFYSDLGWRDSLAGSPEEVFETHFLHFAVVEEARGNTRQLSETARSGDEEFLGVIALADALTIEAAYDHADLGDIETA